MRANAKQLALGLLLAIVGLPAARADAPQLRTGFIEMHDGTRLDYGLYVPAASGQFPVALAYDVYAEGFDPDVWGNDATAATMLLAAGFAVLGVSIRGTSCSGGSLDVINHQWHWMAPRLSPDGSQLVYQHAPNGHEGVYCTDLVGDPTLCEANATSNNDELWVVGANGSHPRPLLNGFGDMAAPQFAPRIPAS